LPDDDFASVRLLSASASTARAGRPFVLRFCATESVMPSGRAVDLDEWTAPRPAHGPWLSPAYRLGNANTMY
jgi:hypothetical protein